MANTINTAPTGPVTEEAFWPIASASGRRSPRFMTYVAVALVLLLIAMWYFLV